jgi:hypothetical protein
MIDVGSVELAGGVELTGNMGLSGSSTCGACWRCAEIRWGMAVTEFETERRCTGSTTYFPSCCFEWRDGGERDEMKQERINLANLTGVDLYVVKKICGPCEAT